MPCGRSGCRRPGQGPDRLAGVEMGWRGTLPTEEDVLGLGLRRRARAAKVFEGMREVELGVGRKGEDDLGGGRCRTRGRGRVDAGSPGRGACGRRRCPGTACRSSRSSTCPAASPSLPPSSPPFSPVSLLSCSTLLQVSGTFATRNLPIIIWKKLLWGKSRSFVAKFVDPQLSLEPLHTITSWRLAEVCINLTPWSLITGYK